MPPSPRLLSRRDRPVYGESPEGNGCLFWPCALAATILFVSSQSIPSSTKQALAHLAHADKGIHIFLFGLLGALLARSRAVQRTWLGAYMAVPLVAAFGLIDELGQGLATGRVCDVYDWTADAVGALAMVVAYDRWSSLRRVLERRVLPVKPSLEGGTANAGYVAIY